MNLLNPIQQNFSEFKPDREPTRTWNRPFFEGASPNHFGIRFAKNSSLKTLNWRIWLRTAWTNWH